MPRSAQADQQAPVILTQLPTQRLMTQEQVSQPRHHTAQTTGQVGQQTRTQVPRLILTQQPQQLHKQQAQLKQVLIQQL